MPTLPVHTVTLPTSQLEALLHAAQVARMSAPRNLLTDAERSTLHDAEDTLRNELDWRRLS